MNLSNNPNKIEPYKHGKKHDQHENDKKFQNIVMAEYDQNINVLNWKKLNCIENGKLLPIEKIHELIWEEINRVV
jgi:hypothetical protein